MPGFELALVQWLVLRHELPDQHVFDHRIIARNELIARFQDALSRIASPCRQPQRLPRERFRPLARNGQADAVVACPLLKDERT